MQVLRGTAAKRLLHDAMLLSMLMKPLKEVDIECMTLNCWLMVVCMAGSVERRDDCICQRGHTYAVLSAELLVERGREDLSSDVGGGGKVSLARNSARRRDHLDEICVVTREVGGG